MAATPVIQSTTSGTGTTNVVISKPASTAQNDLLIAVLNADGTSGSWNTPSGWTLVGAGTNSFNTPKTAIFSKVAGDSEPSSYTFTFSVGSTTCSGRISRITGADPANPVDSSASNGAGSVGSLTIGTLAPTTGANLILEVVSYAGTGQSWSYSCTNVSSFTQLYLDTGARSFNVAYGASSATGSATASISVSPNTAMWAAALSIPPLNVATPAAASATFTALQPSVLLTILVAVASATFVALSPSVLASHIRNVAKAAAATVRNLTKH